MNLKTSQSLKDMPLRRSDYYVGVAPFYHRSGTSVRGKTRVSHLANKDVKPLLHMAALSAIHNCEEIKNYYQRKVAEAVPAGIRIKCLWSTP